MRDWIIKHWAYSYDSKVLGRVGRHLRVVNTAIVLFCIAGLYNLLTPSFDVLQGLAFLPFLVLFFGKSTLFLGGKPKFEELDWEQQYQVLQKGNAPEGNEDLFFELEKRYDDKYLGKKKNVHAWRGIFPFAVILATLIIYFIFGFSEAGFTDMRFF